MTRLGTETLAAAQLDWGEVRRSRWLLFCATVYLLLGGAFVLVGLRESSLFGFTGLGRVLLSLCHGLVLVLPLLALTATGQTINRMRDDGSLEFLFSQPIRRGSYFAGVTLVRLAVLVVPLVLLMIALALWGRFARGHEIPWPFLWRLVLVCTALLVAFVGLGLAASTFVRSQARATITVLLLWAAGVALLDFGLIGLMLEWRLSPRAVFIIAALNPVEDARLALLSDLEPDLESLGPVGFYLANRLGSTLLYVLGVCWPMVVGCTAWLAAAFHFRNNDLV